MRTFILAALAFAVPALALAEPKVGDTLACVSKDPAKRLVATVGAVESFGADRRVAHITLRNEAPGAVPGVMGHLPVEMSALSAGCPKAADHPRPLDANFEAGRQQWAAAVKTQGAGIFTISVDEIDNSIQQTILRQRGAVQ